MIDSKSDIIDAVRVKSIRSDFPILSQQVHGKPLIYLDNGATTQKPQVVIDALKDYYEAYNSNIHRGVHYLSQLATDAYDAARATVQQFMDANSPNEIVFTKGATDSINFVANTFGKKYIQQGDEIIVSRMEHHSNIVPWQMLCEEKGASLKVIPISNSGELDLEAYKNLLTSKTKLVAIVHVSNTLGTINPVKEITSLAHAKGAKVLIDGCQAIQHLKVNVLEIDCDFYCFSGHKIYAPTGIGVLYGKESLLNDIPPCQGGGGMIQQVTFEKTTYACLPHKFEAGTPNIEGAIGLAKALNYVSSIGLDAICNYEHQLLEYATEQLKSIEGVRIIGEAKNRTGVLSFIVNGLHPYDVGTLLDKMGVAVRTGHHCTQPLMDFYKIPGTIRASFAFYNTKEEIDMFINALKKAIKMLS